MPTLLQIQDKDSNPLDALERELVRQLLGISGKAGTSTYIESETRMNGLTPSQCQLVRGLLEDYDDISLDTAKALGGKSGINYDPERDKEAIARELRRLLYPSAANDIVDEDDEYEPLGSIHFIPVEYKTGNQGHFS